jgi:hypothetical protein
MCLVEGGRDFFAFRLKGIAVGVDAGELRAHGSVVQELVAGAAIYGFDAAEEELLIRASIERGKELEVLLARCVYRKLDSAISVVKSTEYGRAATTPKRSITR